VALAQPDRRRRHLAKARALVESGAPLKTIGAALSIPQWMRRLPPEAMARLPAQIGGGDGDMEFGRQIHSLIPRHFPNGGRWLNSILAARRRGGDGFAIWLARQIKCEMHVALPGIGLIAAYAFYSDHPKTLAAQYLPRRFHPYMPLGVAAQSTFEWLLSILLSLKACAARPCFAHTVECDGFSFAPLETLDALCAEARIMRNCLHSYGPSILCDHGRVFSVRRDGVPVASFEVRPGVAGKRPPRPAQLKGPRNVPAPREVAEGAIAWLEKVHDAPSLWRDVPAPIYAPLWRELWAPYRAAHRGLNVLTRDPPASVQDRLLAPLQHAALAAT